MARNNNKSSRREFLNRGIKTAALLPLVSAAACTKSLSQPISTESSSSALKILILGGTSFLGPHQIAYALKQGHSVSMFTRGKTKPTIHTELFDQVEQLIGDREDNLDALKGRKWDVVIDNSGRKVAWTKATAELLKDSCELYMYISSVSVFYPYYTANAKEGDPIVTEIPDVIENEDEKMSYDYGVMKANSENVAMEIFGKDRTIIVRPTFMTGPSDRTNRFMYWPTQLAKGGDIIVPGNADDPVQFIDVRDIAGWMIRLIENKHTGIYNGVGPVSNMTMRAFVHGAHAAFSSPVNYIYIDDAKFLEANDLLFAAPWILEMEKYHGISRVNNKRALDTGLTFTPLAQTVKDTHDWWYSDAVTQDRRDQFLTEEYSLVASQKEILEKWAELNR